MKQMVTADVVYVTPGQGLVAEGMVLPLLKDSYWGPRIVAPLLEIVDDHARDFGLNEPMATIWQRASKEELKDPLLTHLSMYVGCKSVQRAFEERAADSGLDINVMAFAPLSVGRYMALAPTEGAVVTVGMRGLELRGMTGRENYGWPKSLREVNPDFEPDPSGYNMFRIKGLDEFNLGIIESQTGVRLSNINHRNKDGKVTVNISGPTRLAASAADLAEHLGAEETRALNIPPFHNYELMVGFEIRFDRKIMVCDASYGGLTLENPIIDDTNGGIIKTTGDFLVEAGPHGRQTNRFDSVAEEVESLVRNENVIPVVLGANAYSAEAMRALLSQESQRKAVLAFDEPQSIDEAVAAVKKRI